MDWRLDIKEFAVVFFDRKKKKPPVVDFLRLDGFRLRLLRTN